MFAWLCIGYICMCQYVALVGMAVEGAGCGGAASLPSLALRGGTSRANRLIHLTTSSHQFPPVFLSIPSSARPFSNRIPWKKHHCVISVRHAIKLTA